MNVRTLAMLACIVPLCSSLAGAQTTQPAAGPGDLHVERTLKIGGQGRWDYIAVGADGLLYVTRSTHEQIIDPATGKVVADIAGGQGLHGTAVVPSAGRAFVTDGQAAKLLVIDLKTRTLLGSVDAADDADGIIYDAGTDRVLVSCGDAAQLVSIDPKADLASAKPEKIDLGGKPEFLAADGKGRAFVCLNDKNEIAVVDLKSSKVTDRWPCGSGTGPTGVAIDAKNGRLFVGCRNQKAIVIDINTGKVTAELPIGRGNDACAFDEATGQFFASCGDGTTTVIAETTPGTLAVQQTITTANGARTMAVDPASDTLYFPTAQFGPAEQGRRPTALPDSFEIVVVGKK